MNFKACNLILLLIIAGLSACERENQSNMKLRTDGFQESLYNPLNRLSKAFDKASSTLIIKQRNSDFEEYLKMYQLLKPTVLSKSKISLKDLISILIEIFYTNLSDNAKSYLDINNAVVDESMRTMYGNLTLLVEEEIMEYVVPVNFLEIFSDKDNLLRLAVSKSIVIYYLDKEKKMDQMDVREGFHFLMSHPKLYSENLGYSIDSFINLIETLILSPEKKLKENGRVRKSYFKLFEKFANMVREDGKRGTFPEKSWSPLLKIILSEVPKHLRKEIFDGNWKKDIEIKVLDLFKNLSNLYHINMFTLNNLDVNEDFFKEFCRCPRCQRIVLESILKSVEMLIGQYFQVKNLHEEL